MKRRNFLKMVALGFFGACVKPNLQSDLVKNEISSVSPMPKYERAMFRSGNILFSGSAMYSIVPTYVATKTANSEEL